MAKYSVTIDRNLFQAGEKESEFDLAPGISPEEYGCNLNRVPGCLASGATLTDAPTVITGMQIIAWCNNEGQSVDRLACLGSNATLDGQIYSVDYGIGEVTPQGAADSAHDYKKGFSDMVYFNNRWYITSLTDIAEIKMNYATPDYAFWHTTKGKSLLTSSVPHPMIVAKGNLYIADGNKLHMLDSAGTATEALLTLSADKIIYAMEFCNNYLYLYTDTVKNSLLDDTSSSEGTFKGSGVLIIYDGIKTDNTWDQEIKVISGIYALRNVEGTLYYWSPKEFGYWNGSIFKPIRRIDSWPVYKCKTAYFQGKLYFINGSANDSISTTPKSVLCFDGKKFNHIVYSAYRIDSIFCTGSNQMMYSSNARTGYFYLSGATSSKSNANMFTTIGWFELSQLSYIRKIIVEFAENLTTGSDIGFSLINEKHETIDLGNFTATAFGGTYVYEKDGIDELVNSFKLRINWKVASKAIRRIKIILETSEQPNL